MSMRISIILIAAILGAGAAKSTDAQTPVGEHDHEVAQTQRLNQAHLRYQQQRRMHHQSDLAAYDAAMRAHGRKVLVHNVHYLHQRRAYAAAMRAWREQVAACEAGHKPSCEKPAPDPARFY